MLLLFFFSSRRRHTRCALETGVQTCALPISSPVIALVHGTGPIVLAESEDDPLFGRVTMGAIDVAEALATAIDDPEVVAIVFRVDSPGGSYVASDTIWREVSRARTLGKPVVVSMGNLAASGGY